MTTDAVGGVWSYALDLAAGLAEEGLSTTLAVFGPHPSDRQWAAAAAVPGLTLVETGLPLDWTARTPDELRQAAALVRRLVQRTGAELLHLNSPALAFDGGFDIPTIGVCHSCLATWWEAAGEGEPPADFAWRITAHAEGLKACTALIAPSASFADAVMRAYGVRPRVAHNGRRAPRPWPASLGHTERERFVFTAGRLWDRGKNVAVLDAAAGILGAPFAAAGPLQSPTGERVTLENIWSVGSLSFAAMGDWLSRRPVFASLSLYEPFGLAVLEAAQHGCPLVLSDIPTFRELWDDAALFVDPTDEIALADTLDEILANDGLAGRLGAEAKARAGRYSVEAMTAATLAAYVEAAPQLNAAAEAAAA